MLERGVRADFGGDWRQIAGIDVPIDGLPLLADAAIVIDAEVPADADQPRLEVGAAVEGVERSENLQEDVLCQILCLVVLADELVGDVEDLAPVQAHDLLPGLLIAGQTPLNQLVDRWRLGGLVLRRHQDALAETAGWWARGIITKRFFVCQTPQIAISR